MSNNLSMEDIMKLAASPAGQQLMQLLRQNNPENLQHAMRKAAEGDLQAAKAALSDFTEDPEIKKLLEQIGR